MRIEGAALWWQNHNDLIQRHFRELVENAIKNVYFGANILIISILYLLNTISCHSFFPSIFIYLFKYLKGRVTEKERERQAERDIFQYLVHFSNYHNSHSWTRMKPGVKNSIWVSHMGVRYSNTPFPGALKGCWIGSGRAGTLAVTLKWDGRAANSNFTHCTTVPATMQKCIEIHAYFFLKYSFSMNFKILIGFLLPPPRNIAMPLLD